MAQPHVSGATTAELPLPAGFRANSLRGTPGYFRVGQDEAGRWWWVDPAGEPFFCKAVHGVKALPAPGADAVESPDNAASRLRRWGFNTVGLGGDRSGRDDGLPGLGVVGFCETGPLVQAPGVRLPDVFAPEWPVLAADRALAFCGPHAFDAGLLGWVLDDTAQWGQAAGRPGLLQVCLSLEPGFSAYHAAWEFVLALHGRRLEAVARSWGADFTHREGVRELTRSERVLTSRGYARDEARWTREFARRYFAGAASAVRAAAPHHLVLGGRWSGPVGAEVRAECGYPAIDVTLVDWSEVPASAPGPLLADNACWADPGFHAPVPAPRGGRKLSTLERMLRRGRTSLERLARHPAVVGFVWRQWLDEPGEQPPFARGLVHVNGSEAREHTEILAACNHRAETLRRAATPPLSPS